jgi:hypothetical protein
LNLFILIFYLNSVMSLVRLVETSLARQECNPLPVQGGKWYEIEHNTNVECSNKFVHDSCAFVEACSICKHDVLAVINSHWWVVQNLLQSITL